MSGSEWGKWCSLRCDAMMDHSVEFTIYGYMAVTSGPCHLHLRCERFLLNQAHFFLPSALMAFRLSSFSCTHLLANRNMIMM
jgi:hypothetical protein